jgi:hypothetical protein
MHWQKVSIAYQRLASQPQACLAHGKFFLTKVGTPDDASYFVRVSEILGLDVVHFCDRLIRLCHAGTSLPNNFTQLVVGRAPRSTTENDTRVLQAI